MTLKHAYNNSKVNCRSQMPSSLIYQPRCHCHLQICLSIHPAKTEFDRQWQAQLYLRADKTWTTNPCILESVAGKHNNVGAKIYGGYEQAALYTTRRPRQCLCQPVIHTDVSAEVREVHQNGILMARDGREKQRNTAYDSDLTTYEVMKCDESDGFNTPRDDERWLTPRRRD